MDALAQLAEKAPEQASKLWLEAAFDLSVSLERLTAADKELREQSEILANVQEELESQRRRYQELFEFAPDGYLVTDCAGVVREANQAALSLFELRRIEGKPLSVFVVEDRLRDFRQRLNQLPAGATTSWQTRFISRSGREFPADVRVSVIRADSGAASSLRWFIRDVTERAAIEEQLHELNYGLEQKVAERTAHLVEADRHKDEFLAMLGHELRNPLAPILVSLQLIRIKREQPEVIEECGATAERQVMHLMRLVDDLLDVSRVARGQINLKRQPCDLREVIDEVQEMVAPEIEKQQHELQVNQSAEAVWVEGDKVRLTQIIANMLTNAIRNTDSGGHIGLSLETEEDQAVVRVADTGRGISPEMLPKVFDMFMQADRSQRGLGIGLTLARRLTEMHGGTIEAKSAGPGQGAEFVVRFPRRAEPPGAGDSESSIPNNDQYGQLVKIQRILVVDDNYEAAKTVAMLLRSQGCEVQVAHDGLGALIAIDNFQPELAILDLGLPGMDGYELAREIRLRPGGEKIRLIALTGYGQREDFRRSHEAGFEHHIVKPVDIKTLSNLVAC